jgi:transcriptional regulator with XRE-family HTH domain
MILTQLARVRLNAALSQRDLAALAHVSPGTIVNAERGEHVYPSTVRKLATALGVEPVSLAGQRNGSES